MCCGQCCQIGVADTEAALHVDRLHIMLLRYEHGTSCVYTVLTPVFKFQDTMVLVQQYPFTLQDP